MTTSTATLACISEPISWLRLETFALGVPDASIDAHVAECSACRHCLEQLRADSVELPALVIPTAVKKAQRAWWKTAVPALVAAAAAVALIVVVKKPNDTLPPGEEYAAVKGVGTVVLGTVRERNGSIVEDARSYAPGDRWKLVLTCPPAGELHTDVTITEVGGATTIDRPLAPATIACGNRIVLPGAFTLNGTVPNRVCVALGGGASACVTIKPE